ncbi:MAG: shikimate dehydrogenase [Chloroflexi bacterium]|nr:shikimate dehydrogenase [Chloroflexota bacterium]
MINGETRLVGIIGWPVEHSLSPVMHNAAFHHRGMNWAYVPLPVPPDRLRDAVRGLRALGFRGANVTIPHKQAVIPLVDSITPEAQAVGAVNTIVVESDGRMWGTNTDVLGFWSDLQAHDVQVEGERVLVLGAGGAARAVVYALARAGAQVTIANRTPARAVALARHMHHMLPARAFRVVEWTVQDLARAAEEHTILVNTTSVGMWPEVDASPWPTGVGFGRIRVVYDVIYRPQETRLLQHARAWGCKTIGGLGMLVRQGAEAWRLWTDQVPPVQVMEEAVRRGLAER